MPCFRMMVDLCNVSVKGAVRLKGVVDLAFVFLKICPVFLPPFAHAFLFRQRQTRQIIVPTPLIPEAVIFVINILVRF